RPAARAPRERRRPCALRPDRSAPRTSRTPGPWPSLDPLRILDPLHAPPPPHTLGGIRSGRSPPFPASTPLPARPQRPAPSRPGGIMLLERIYDPDLSQTSYLIGCQAENVALVVDPRRY